MIPYNNFIIVPVDTGYGNIKNSLHSFPTGIAAYKTKPAFEGKILHISQLSNGLENQLKDFYQ